MILPGTLVMYLGRSRRLRAGGVYTVLTEEGNGKLICTACMQRGCSGLFLSGVDNGLPEDDDPPELRIKKAPGWASCWFRIIAPPITEADRLEASAPTGGVKPARKPVNTPVDSHERAVDQSNGTPT